MSSLRFWTGYCLRDALQVYLGFCLQSDCISLKFLWNILSIMACSGTEWQCCFFPGVECLQSHRGLRLPLESPPSFQSELSGSPLASARCVGLQTIGTPLSAWCLTSLLGGWWQLSLNISNIFEALPLGNCNIEKHYKTNRKPTSIERS